jgi:hypothetical protein
MTASLARVEFIRRTQDPSDLPLGCCQQRATRVVALRGFLSALGRDGRGEVVLYHRAGLFICPFSPHEIELLGFHVLKPAILIPPVFWTLVQGGIAAAEQPAQTYMSRPTSHPSHNSIPET